MPIRTRVQRAQDLVALLADPAFRQEAWEFYQWRIDAYRLDVAGARKALKEPGESIPYEKLRRQLGRA